MNVKGKPNIKEVEPMIEYNNIQSDFDPFNEQFYTLLSESTGSYSDLDDDYFIDDYYQEVDQMDWQRELYDLYNLK